MKKVFVSVMSCPKKRQIKLIYLFVLFMLLSPALYAQITVEVQNQPIRQILKTIEKTSDYKFFYNNDLLNLDKKISFSVKNETIEATMEKLLADTDITYKKEKDHLIVLTLKSKKQDIQKKEISGIIVDENGDPVIGANVVEKGTTNGTITGLDGSFSLEVSQQASLLVSYIGYLNQEMKISGNQSSIYASSG